MKDFIHKTLINAGGKDAVSNMLTGAAMGAGANTALGAIQGDFDIIGNATSGALLGAGGGAALRHAGDKYTSGIAAMQKAGKEVPGTFNTNIFTHAIKEEADFMGNPEMMKRAQGMAGMPSAKGATTNAPTGGSVNTGSRKDGGVNRPGAEGHRDQPIAPTHVEIPSMPSFDRMGMPMSSGTAKIPVVPNTDSVGEAIGRSGNKKGGGFTPMNAEQAKAAQAEKDVLDAKKANRENLKSTFNRNKVKEQSIDRRQQRVMDKQIDSDIKSVNGDLSQMGNMPYTPSEIAKGYQRSGKDANQWAQNTVAKQTQSIKDSQGAAGDLIAGIFKETGRGPIKKPTSFADGAGTLSLPKGKIDSSNFTPTYKNGEYQHPQHMKVKKYQPEKK